MEDDAIQVFREMLSSGGNRVENLPADDDTGNAVVGMGGGGGQSVPPSFGEGGGGMDPWQTSVENRLTSLDGRLGKIEDRLGGVETSTATLSERVSHLPTKGWGVTALLMLFAAVAGVVTFQDNIHHLFSGSNASGAPQIQAERNNG